MKYRLILTVLTLLLVASGLLMLPGSIGPIAVHASNARLEVWSPDVHSSNITSLTAYPVGSTFKVVVNVTGTTTTIGAFDMTLNDNLTAGPNVLSVVSATLAGGLFDPNNPPTGCTVLNPNHDLFVHGFIHYSATFVGGCARSLPGTLLTLQFQVQGVGVGSIDILQAGSQGGPETTLVHQGANIIPYDAYNALFWNQPGIPPVPVFIYDPSSPSKGDTVMFNGTRSYDPDNPSGPNHGIQPEPVVYNTENDGKFHAGTDPVIYGAAPVDATVLSSDRNLVFNDTKNGRHWVAGDSVIYDTDNSLTYTPGDVLVSGPKPKLNAALTSDPKIRYVEIHANGIWDNGYLWDFGDGSASTPGNFTLHVFTNGPTVRAYGTFSVKLVVYDVDDGLEMRQRQLIYISPGIVHDVVVNLSLDKIRVNVGESLGVTVTIANRGTRNEMVDTNATYTYNGVKTVGAESKVNMPIQAIQSFSYALQTSSLLPGTYTINAQVGFRNPNSTSLQYFTPTNPGDAFATASFTVQEVGGGSGVSLLLVAGSASAAIVVVSVLVSVLRRRKKEES